MFQSGEGQLGLFDDRGASAEGWRGLGVLPTAEHHIDGAEHHRLIWHTFADASSSVQQILADTAAWPSFGHLLEDLFAAYFRIEPTLRDPDTVMDTVRANRPYVERLLTDSGTPPQRDHTVLQPDLAALHTLALAIQLAEEIRQSPSLDHALQEQAAPPEASTRHLERLVHHAAKVGGDTAQQEHDALLAWAPDGTGGHTVPADQRLDLARKLLTPRFQRMAQLIGRMKNLARARQAHRLDAPPEEVVGLTLGNDLARVLPEEIATLTHPLRGLDTKRRFLEGKLWQEEIRPRARRDQGPLLCLIDSSGSMAGPRIEWAMAVGLALADTARRQRRHFGVVTFDTRLGFHGCWPKGQIPPADVLALAEHGCGGGTAFNPPICWGLEQLEQSIFHHADLVLITDGGDDAGLFPETQQALAQARETYGVRVLTLLISGSPDAVTQWSDRVWDLAGVLHDEAAAELFTTFSA